MTHSTRNFQLLLSALLILIAIIVPSACKKLQKDYISQQDFIDKIKGEYYVGGFEQEAKQYCDTCIGVRLSWNENDIISYTDVQGFVTTFSINDSALCTLPLIGNMSYWTISANNNDLTLETQDLCGVTKDYKMDYSDYHYQENLSGSHDHVRVNIKLASSDTTITIQQLELRWGDYGKRISYQIEDSIWIYDITLVGL